MIYFIVDIFNQVFTRRKHYCTSITPIKSPGLALIGTPNTRESSEELEKQGGCLRAVRKHGGLSLTSSTSNTKLIVSKR